MAVVVQHVRVGLADRVRDDLVAHEAAVHEEVLRVARGAREAGRRRRGRARRSARALGRAPRPRAAAKSSPMMRAARSRRPSGGRCDDAPAVVREREGDAGARQRDAREGLLAARELGRLALQELAARGRVEVEILDVDRGAGGERGGLDRARRCRPRMRCARRGARPAARLDDREARHRADRGERLAAEAQRRGALEVLERGDLAGGEARDGERQVVALDAAAVVDHAHAPHAALGEVDRDRCAPASRLFSISSLRAEAGRSTTSPAAIWLTSSSGRVRMWPTRECYTAPHTCFAVGARPAPKERHGPLARAEAAAPRCGAGADLALQAEQLRLLFRFSLVGHLATLLVVFILGAILWDDLARPALFAWFVAISLVAIGRYLLYKAFIQRNAARPSAARDVGGALHRRHHPRRACAGR